jgi:hypothetical protein
LTRLGSVAGLILLLVAVGLASRHLLITKTRVDSVSAESIGADKPKPTSSVKSASDLASGSAQGARGSAAPDIKTRFDAGFSIQSTNSADYFEAIKLIIPAPPHTELGLQNADPRRLRAHFQRGVAALQSDVDDQIVSGARLISIAAIFGYEPARMLIVQRYPSSAILRSALKSTEAIRYSLDPLFTPGAQSAGNRNFLVLLASYFSGHQALSDYANDLLAALGDDERLQTSERLELLFKLLARVRGACTAVAMAIVKARTVTGPECSSGLQLHIANYLKATAPPGLEAESRRHGLKLLNNAEDIARPLAQSPAGD